MGEYLPDWASLRGHVVCIRRKGRLIRVGEVETVAPQGHILWLKSQGVEPRTLYQKSEGYTVWSLPADLQDDQDIHFVQL
jgi:hypothetical protein